jgi:3-isopropylmalate dehydrogenase
MARRRAARPARATDVIWPADGTRVSYLKHKARVGRLPEPWINTVEVGARIEYHDSTGKACTVCGASFDLRLIHSGRFPVARVRVFSFPSNSPTRVPEPGGIRRRRLLKSQAEFVAPREARSKLDGDDFRGKDRSYRACIDDEASRLKPPAGPCLVGVLKGEGIGPETIECALEVLEAIGSRFGRRFELEVGGEIGIEALRRHGTPLSPAVAEFCSSVFERRGAILAGPGGGRFVYDLRKQFDLFCKLSPLQPSPELVTYGPLKPEFAGSSDIMVVRECVCGIYQGSSSQFESPAHGRVAEHTFSYSEAAVRRIVQVACRIAKLRRRELAVVTKESGIPGISALWRDVALGVAKELDVNARILEIDYAAYMIVRHARELDVIVTSNLFGDVLSDLGGILAGSRGLTYSGNFAADGSAVYQTNHGACHDLAGTDRANPIGQIYSLAMLLNESFGQAREARAIRQAVAKVWREGYRTFDIDEAGCDLVGTRRMGELVARSVVQVA